MSSLSFAQLLLLIALYQFGDLPPGTNLSLTPETPAAEFFTGPVSMNITVEKNGWIALDEDVWIVFDGQDIAFRVKGEVETLSGYHQALGLRVSERALEAQLPGAEVPIQFLRAEDKSKIHIEIPEPDAPPMIIGLERD